ncbi:MAG: hypothetical protein JRJ29_20635 [Deltaproteobacteria bacterium]|nr:hypothetical protein [Deltaproteobacteria bacterium]
MKGRTVFMLSVFAILLGIAGFSSIPHIGSEQAFACACAYRSGEPGGGDYVPQEQGKQGGAYSDGSALTKEQAHDLVKGYLRRSNPNLEIGAIRDAGNFFEADILSPEKKVVEKLAVDKETGQIRVIY